MKNYAKEFRFQIDTCFFKCAISSLSAEVRIPNLIPGTPNDFEMLFMTMSCGYCSNSSSCSSVLFSQFSLKSTKLSSIIRRKPFFLLHSHSLSRSVLGMKLRDGLSGLIINKVSFSHRIFFTMPAALRCRYLFCPFLPKNEVGRYCCRGEILQGNQYSTTHVRNGRIIYQI